MEEGLRAQGCQAGLFEFRPSCSRLAQGHLFGEERQLLSPACPALPALSWELGRLKDSVPGESRLPGKGAGWGGMALW